MIREEATEKILEAKKEKRLTYAAMAEQLLKLPNLGPSASERHPFVV